MPTDERAADPGALVAEARVWHRARDAGWVGGQFEQYARCLSCVARWPCLPARLATALEQAQEEIAERERRRMVYAKQVAGATEATRKEHAEALAFEREQRNLRHDAWLEAVRERDAARAEAAPALRAWAETAVATLKQYGIHSHLCRANYFSYGDGGAALCTCGFSAAKAAALRAAREPALAEMAMAAVELLAETAETEAHLRLKAAVAAYLIAARWAPE